MDAASKPRRTPCASCPYRTTVASGIWHEEEYAKLEQYDLDMVDQPPAVLVCHQGSRDICSGWLAHRDPADLLAVRLGVISGEIDPACLTYETSTPLFASGAEAAAHGRREIEQPGEKAVAAIAKIIRVRACMFGIRAAKIVQLRAEDVSVTEETVLIRLGAEPLVLPAELAPAAVGAASNRTAPRMFVESIEQEWVYPGARAGHHMAPDTLNARLRAVGIPPRLARTSALIALAQELPPVVLSRLTGLDITSAIAWSNAIGANSNAYAAAVLERIGMPIPIL